MLSSHVSQIVSSLQVLHIKFHVHFLSLPCSTYWTGMYKNISVCIILPTELKMGHNCYTPLNKLFLVFTVKLWRVISIYCTTTNVRGWNVLVSYKVRPFIFQTQEVSGQLHAPATLPQGKQPTVSTVQEARWTPEFIWMLWRGEKFLATARIWADSSVVQPIPTMIPLLMKVYIPDT